MTASHTPHPTRIALREGQTLHARLRAGTQIVVTRGSVLLVESPAWQGETLFTARATLADGQAHGVSRTGWVEIAALAPTEIVQYAELPVAVALRIGLKTWVARLLGQGRPPVSADVKTL
jgi:hypothetical protein